MRAPRRIIICGKSGSGKDHLRKKLEERGFQYGVPYTTRPRREEEINGRDYWFLSDFDFQQRQSSDYFSFVSRFNNWSYGFSQASWNYQDIFILTPNVINQLSKRDRSNSFIIYLDIEKSIRRSRIQMRNSNEDSLERRLIADDEDFSDFSDFDLRLTNENF